MFSVGTCCIDYHSTKLIQSGSRKIVEQRDFEIVAWNSRSATTLAEQENLIFFFKPRSIETTEQIDLLNKDLPPPVQCWNSLH